MGGEKGMWLVRVSLDKGGKDGGENVQAADARVRRAKRERMRVVGCMLCRSWVDDEVGKR